MSEQEKVIWELDFKISPVPSWDEEIAGFIFKKGDENVKARIEYFIDRYPKREDAYIVTVPEHEASQHLRRLILLKSIHNGWIEPITVKMEQYKLLNREKLKLDGYKTRILFEQFQLIPIIVLREKDYFSEAIDYWSSGFQVKTRGLEDDLIEIAELVVKSKEEDDSIRGFIMIYIAFNHLYANFSKKILPPATKDIHTKIEIHNVVSNLLTDKDCEELYEGQKNIIERLTEWSIYAGNGKNLSIELRKAMDEHKDSREIIGITCECIWKIRNEIFHCSIDAKNILNKAKVARSILDHLMNICMRNYVNYK